ncbi:MAG TPA: SAM-dependent methyltransferase [Legionellales bacterium]|nr:SAM-dependent methyltransferase [Legionellales bacterium]
MMSVISDFVSEQYDKWSYPQPIMDLPSWLNKHWQWFDPSHSHHLFWPNCDYPAKLDILVAGCGSNQAAVLAYTNPTAQVVAIDVSKTALKHHEYLKKQYQLKNLELQHLPIEQVNQLNREFDLIISTGVLHHLLDPLIGLQSLAQCLRAEGVMALMLYAKYGRAGVEMLQGVFRDLGLQQDGESIAVVQAALSSLPVDHPLHVYMRLTPDLKFNAGLVDTFLHRRDRSYTVDDCLELVDSSGLVFQDWYFKSPYYPGIHPENSFYDALAQQPLKKQWAVMERIAFRNACHFFMACHPMRSKEKYQFDFESDAILHAIPSYRYKCFLDGQQICRPDWKLELENDDLKIVRLIDGSRSIVEIIQRFILSESLDFDEVKNHTLMLLKLLVHRDFLLLKQSV